MISVVIPLYNKADYISKSIKSVLEQTFTEFEIVVVDDGSTDNSIEVIQSSFNDDRLRIIKQENQGVSAAKNTGIKESKYELVAFLDADDWWGNTFLQSIVELTIKYPDISMYAVLYAVVKDRKIHAKKILPENEVFACFDLIKYGLENINLPIHSSSLVIRKNILTKSGVFDEKIRFYEDYDFFLRIAAYSKVGYKEGEPQAFYNQDVPVEQKITGKIHPIETHFINHTDKLTSFYKERFELKIYIDKFTTIKLLAYKNHFLYKVNVKKIFNTVDLKNIPLKYILAYYVPRQMTNLILKINLILKKYE